MKQVKNVIIDARMVNAHLHGIGRYTYELIKGISIYGENIHIKLLVNDLESASKIFKGIDNIEFIKIKAKFLSLFEQIELPLILNNIEPNAIFHSPSFVSSPFINCKSIMTIHDLNHLELPQMYSRFHKYYYKYIVKPSALKCNKVITVSNFSKLQIMNWLNCDDNKIEVTYNGVDKKYCKIDDAIQLEKVKKAYNLTEKFILYIGNLKPHKNLETLLKSMKIIKSNVVLVVNGKENDRIKEFIEERNLQNKVRFIGYVEEEDLPILLNLAKIFVFPSLYEGFGLPPLEAMACGCPVICSNKSSLPEVVGDAALLFNPLDEEELSEKIDQVIQDEKLYNDMRNKGMVQATKFNWEDMVRKTLKEYEKIF